MTVQVLREPSVTTNVVFTIYLESEVRHVYNAFEKLMSKTPSVLGQSSLSVKMKPRIDHIRINHIKDSGQSTSGMRIAIARKYLVFAMLLLGVLDSSLMILTLVTRRHIRF